MPRRFEPLPIDDVLSGVVDRLRASPNLVLVAPPGSGKTTRVPGALIDAGVVEGRVLVLEPRRLAARLAASRIAEERGVRLGDEVGYQVRFDDRTSARTRIALITEGILTRRVQSDPLLEGVGAVILDEVHERSIHADLGLAFLREIQETVRPELRIVAMSATIDPAPLAKFLGDCPVVLSDGRIHPVETRWLERPDDRDLVDLTVSGVRRALREVESGDVLTFLPGAGEIRRVQERLTPHLDDSIELCPLYGELDSAAQDRAVRPGPRRKVILATNIAESSLTIPGVTTVVDSGFQKIARHDPALGVDRLELARIGQRSATQRAGRAGRLGPGVAYRLWTEKAHALMPAEDPPEIRRVDLAPVIMEVVRWSSSDPARFGWFDPPPPASIERAVELLRALGALEEDRYALTPVGESIAALPLHPRLSMILRRAMERGLPEVGARIAALSSERDIVREDRRTPSDRVAASDLLERCDRMEAFEHGARAHELSVDVGAVQNVLRTEKRLLELARRAFGRGSAKRVEASEENERLRLVLAGFPDRVARRRAPGDDRLILTGGGAARLARESVVKDSELLIAVRIDGDPRTREGIVRIASQIERRWLEEDTRGVHRVHAARWNPTREAAEALIQIRYHDLVLEERPDPKGSPEALATTLAEAARQDLDRALPITDELSGFLNRYAFLRRTMPDLELPELGPEHRASLTSDLCRGKKSFAQLQAVNLVEAYERHLEPTARASLDRQAPTHVNIPSGRRAKLRYEPEGPPALSVRLQEVFGLYETPRVANGRVPIKMELLAPNQRPVQVTQDLRSFWDNTYTEVRKELRRRYPKHQWPEDPREGIATTRVRPKR